MLTEYNGENPRKCAALTATEADAIFFPGSGGKVNKARQFCNDCPVKALCLNEALDFKLVGFWAGTTDDERSGMMRFRQGVSLGLEIFMPPEPPRRRRVYRKVDKTPVLHAAYLDEIEPPEELLVLIG